MNYTVEKNDSIKNKADLSILEQVMFGESSMLESGRVNSQNLLDEINSIDKELKDRQGAIKKTSEEVMKAASLGTFLLNQVSLFSLFALCYFFLDKNEIFPILSGIGSFFYLIFVGLIHLIEPEEVNYSWIRKIVERKKHLEMKRWNLEQYIQKVQTIINKKHFQHAYLAHLQLNVKNLQETMEILRQKNQLEDYNLIQKLASYLEYFKISQNNLVNMWSEEEPVQKIVTIIVENETRLTHINAQLNHGNGIKQQKFIAEHNEFLQKQGLIHLLDNAPSPEKLKALL
jgi:hypothetical protein